MNKRHIHNHGFRLIVAVFLMTLMMAGQASAQSTGVKVHGNVYGGGNLANVGQSVTVNVSGGVIDHDVYGGGAKAHTNTANWNEGSSTFTQTYHAVNIKEGESVVGYFTDGSGTTPATGTAPSGGGTYYKKTETIVNLTGGLITGDVYGGGLGDKASLATQADPNHEDKAAIVYGDVTVNIGTTDGAQTPTYTGDVTINGSVFGCNNLNGTPKGDVKVNVYQTAHNDDNTHPSGITTLDELAALVETEGYSSKFALAAVYGGGNQAAYAPAVTTGNNANRTTVHVYGCENNTIQTVYGGGNAADATHVRVIIDGGFIDRVFGGGNGYSATGNHSDPSLANYNPGANISGSATTQIHGGIFRQVFGGSNQYGDVANASLTIEELGCTLLINESFGGANEAVINGDVTTTLACGNNKIGTFYGGSNMADINGSVTLNVEGGTYINVFGGSKGRLAKSAVGQEGQDGYQPAISAKAANIRDDVTLNLYGGTMDNAFGGSDVNGNIGGKITVNMLDKGVTGCGLVVHNIYGGGRNASYTPTTPGAYPEVNLIHGTVSQKAVTVGGNTTYIGGNVFGGGLGSTAAVNSNPTVNVGYVSTMSSLVPSGTTLTTASVTVEGDVYGGGEEAAVAGGVTVNIQEGTVDGMTISTTVKGDVYGGGALADTNTDNWVSNALVYQYQEVTLTADASLSGYYTRSGSEGSYTYTLQTEGNYTSGTYYQRIDTKVNLTGGTIEGDVYGGGLGRLATTGDNAVSEVQAKVYGDVTVTVNGTKMKSGYTTDANPVLNAGRVFGANNINGTPKGHVKVLVVKTAEVTGQAIDVTAVFGGGNKATYEPYNSTTEYAEVEINKPTGDGQRVIIGNVYGGGNEAGITGGTQVNIVNGDVKSGVYGGCNTSGSVSGTAMVNLTGGTVGTSGTSADIVFGGGFGSGTNTTTTIVNVGVATTTGENPTTTYSGSSTIYSNVYGGSALGTVGTATVNLYKATTLDGDVFGGGKGEKTANSDISANVTTATVKLYQLDIPAKNIYGGCNVNGTAASTRIDLYGGSVTSEGNTTYFGKVNDVYGGGKGQHTSVTTSTLVNVGQAVNTGEATVNGDIYGGSEMGAVNAPTVNIYAAALLAGNVFGGGKGIHDTSNSANNVSASVTGLTTVNMAGATVTKAIYGGCNANGTSVNTEVNVTGGTVGVTTPVNDVQYGIFGGGYGVLTSVTGNVVVNIGKYESSSISGNADIKCDVYGGSAKGSVNTNTSNTTTVNLLAGTIAGNVYGGGLGVKSQSENIEAEVYGNVLVSLNEHDGTCIIGGSVFGCNNVNGSPEGQVTVHVYKTEPRDGQTYDLAAVYGGGNEADYVPTASGVENTQVIIEGCNQTSINNVYGGGNAAAVPGTEVWVLGTEIINNVYGGGNGELGAAYAAHVGFHRTSDTTHTDYTEEEPGSYKTEVNLVAGTINNVYGGSNSNGDIRNGADVKTATQSAYTDKYGSTPAPDCCNKLITQHIYGGGSQADMSGDVNVILECMPDDYVDAVYGGAANATINGNVSLIVTSGKFGRVFGGNNRGGSINGTISVVAKEEGCKPLEIGELYGGGNQAPYSKYGCSESNGTWTAITSGTDHTIPEGDTEPAPYAIDVLVESCTSIGKIFGGGNLAEVIGNTHVEINMFHGSATDANPSTNRPIGKIGQVFGGGNQAKVTGKTTIDIGTDGEQKENGVVPEGQKKGVNIISSDNDFKYINPDYDPDDEEKPERISITAGVYGGGNAADVVGDTEVNIGTANQSLGINITGDIFGGGYGETTTVTGNVTVNIGANTGTNYVGYANITGDVYGGSAKGKVNATKGDDYDTDNTDIGATSGKTTTVNFYGGTIQDTDTPSGKGNIYGGGLGDATYAADVYGPVTVNVYEGCSSTANVNNHVNNVFGCNNVNGAPQSTVTVTMNGGTINNSVYGGGNQAAYSVENNPNKDQANAYKKYPVVNINNGTVTGNVFGGGYGLTATVTGSPQVTIGDNVNAHAVAIGESVYGGGELAGVDYDTNIRVLKGAIGDANGVNAGERYGNVYGAGKGALDNVEAGIVKGNTNISISGGNIYHNIYGGGAYGSVGTITRGAATYVPGKASVTNMPTSWVRTVGSETGKATITITGGTIGINGHENGMVYGSSRGNVATPTGDPAVDPNDRLAWVYETEVIIGTQDDDTGGPTIKGSIYGSGENGHTYQNASVTIHGGTIGIHDGSDDDATRGNVYGGGCGTDMYDSDEDDVDDTYNKLSGIVLGTATVLIDGGQVMHNVYGAGAMGSVNGNTSVTITGDAVVGYDGVDNGNVYAAARGNILKTDPALQLATVGSTSLIISGGEIKGSAFGGGEAGLVSGAVMVSMSGGTVNHDVYGGGALANTNTDNWDATANSGEGDWAEGKTSATYTTTVSMSGGEIQGSLYGGGLGRVAANAVSAVAAMVYGNVTVTTTGGKATNVFGCNNLNGAPQGTVTVNINGTTAGTTEVPYAIGNVYGGGNLASYTYTDGPTVTVSGASYVDNVFGGGNQASVEKTHVTISATNNSSRINKVFGGGNQAGVTHDASVSMTSGNVLGAIYGGCNASGTIGDDVTIDITGGTIGAATTGTAQYKNRTITTLTYTSKANVHGGGFGKDTYVKGNVTVNVGSKTGTGSSATSSGTATIYGDVYGGGALGLVNAYDNSGTQTFSSNKKTIVNLNRGLIYGNVFGGGLGQQGVGEVGDEDYVEAIPAYVGGDVEVTQYDVAYYIGYVLTNDETDLPIPVTGRIFGCNNLNGTPKGDVTVEVWRTRRIDDGAHTEEQYEIQAVYSGGNRASYTPSDGKITQVKVHGCADTVIESVYGGGNAADVPASLVTIYGAFEIESVFGGGNGSEKTQQGNTWVDPVAANVNGAARVVLQGGNIRSVFGGSNTRGNCQSTTVEDKSQEEGNQGECILKILNVYGGGRSADMNGDVNLLITGCNTKESVENIYGGSYSAKIKGNVTLTITGGVFYKVFGGNDQGGFIDGTITVNLEETDDCKPLIISNLYGGGNQANYPGTGATQHPVGNITMNIKSCTRIDNLYGGGLQADVTGNTNLNINMTKGAWAGKAFTLPEAYKGTHDIPNIHNGTIDYAIGTIGNVYGGGDNGKIIGNTFVNIGTETSVGYIIEPVQFRTNAETPLTPNETTHLYDIPVEGVNITGNVYGGGNMADIMRNSNVNYITGNTYVNICSKMGAAVLDNGQPTGAYAHTKVAERANTAGVKIGNSVYGGGCEADVKGNTFVTMSDGYVFNGIFGGGYSGSVGTFTRSDAAADVNVYGHTAHTGCSGKPVSCAANTGKCTVVVDGGQIGPVDVAVDGMNAAGGPNPHGWVWGGGCGLIEGPSDNPDTHFQTYVGSTDVTIGGDAFIMESIIGGGEFGRVLNNTLVKIEGNCQIGVGNGQYNKDGNNNPTTPKRYTDAQFINPTNTVITGGDNGNALAECSHFPYGNNKHEYLPYDPYYDTYPDYVSEHTDLGPASTSSPSDGKTWIGCVFGGGSGYMPYLIKDENNPLNYKGYDWCRSAGWVEGNTEVIITGGHILTNVYGGNEYTDVKGKCTVKMTGGTIGVPRTLEQIAAHPLSCYLFGAGKGDQRSHFYNYTNVGSVEVEVSGGIIYGSVFGGSEDGHVLGDVKVDIKPGAIIGTWGTSYVDGNVFGGGRGFSGEELTAGAVGGKVDINITGGTILGSIYGGGRLGSVGMDLSLNPNGTKTSNFGKMKTTGTDGDITIDISGGTIGNKHEFVYTPTEANVPKTLLEESGKLMHTKGGNVYAGGMGRRTKLDDVTVITDWQKLGNVKSTKLMISGTPWIKGNVYGGGEFGAVTGSRQVMDGETAVKDENNQNINAGTQIFISGGIIGTVMGSTINNTTGTSNEVGSEDDTRYAFGSVYGGGYGTEVEVIDNLETNDVDESDPLTTDVNKFGAFVTGNTYVKVSGSDTKVRASVYGGGEMACVGGNTYVNVSNGEIGVGEVRAATTDGGDKDYVLFGSWKMGNVYGAGKGSTNAIYSGIVKGNSFVDISGGSIYHNVYGGGAYGSVGTFTPTSAVPSAWTANTGKATVKITGGTIGINGWDNGMVCGSGRGDVSAAAFSDPYDKLAWVYDTDVKIGTSGSNTGPSIKGSVYGGGENGHNYHNADVNIYSGTIGVSKSDNKWGSMNIGSRGNVYGAGCGTDTYTYTENQGQANQKTFQRHNAIAGLVRGNATVTVSGGRVYNSVYGGGSMGSVGTITNFENLDASYKHSAESTDGKGTLYGFGLSWPYELQYADNTGLATVTVKGSAEIGEIVSNVVYGGYVFGAPKGKVDVGTDDITKQRYIEAKLANVKNAVVNIGTSETSGNDPKIHHSVYGGGEDGHVYENASVTLYHGTIDRSVFGGGKGEGQFTTTLRKATGTDQNPTYDDLSNQVAYSWTAGRVYGNTTVTMNGGNVGYFVYGGGNLGSVGKGNYSGGADDYSTVGYGELPSSSGNLWTSTSSTDMAYHFLHSGTSTVNILGGTVGTVSGADNSGIPYGSIFGGSRGRAAASCRRSPRYRYVPDFFLGYVNKTIVNIGGTAANAPSSNSPIIHGSVYGGGQDGHVRNSAEVHVYKGSVEGQANDSFGRSGHVFGAGSGIGTYDTGRVDAQKNPIMAVNNSSGSVTCTSLVEVNGSDAYIAGNVYGGGALASVGPPKTSGPHQTLDEKNTSSGDWNSYSYSQVNINAGTIGGNVFAASRGAGDSYLATNPYFDTDDGSYDPTKYATDIWSNVNVSGGKIGYDSNGNVVASGGSVYGGGETGLVKCGVNVNITGGEIAKDVYGGGALANTQTSNSETVKNTTNVYLNGGLINGNAYGGGLGRRESGTSGNSGYIAPIPATVFGDINVYLGGNATEASASATAFNITYYTDAHSNVVKSGRVFGCNNLNGSPQGDVTVTVWKTVEGNTPRTAAEDPDNPVSARKDDGVAHTYELAAVYGGGNLAAYSPTAAGKKASVIIKTCDVSVQEVYGGGNAAAVPQTDVLINGAYEIESVFGGGNGEDPYTLDGGEHWEVNQGADVNGNATTLLKGGYIHEAYGGSNSKGTISGDVSIDKSSGGACTLIVNDIYGAGKNADVEGDLILIMGCSESRTENVYGCSKNANVKGNVELTITSGEYGKVFGGNNESGSIFGHIIVNIEETGCTPIIIDELYGCGNDATYSVYGYYQAKQYTDASNNLFLDIDKTIPLYKDGSDNLFKDARMTIPLFKDDNDLLYIDQDKIRPLYMPRKSAGDHNTIVTFADLNSHTVPDATTHQYDDPQVNIYSCTRIGKVFGGGLGSNAIVYGNPKVNINMMPGSHATDGKLGQVGCGYTANSESVEGGVFGGGNEARVEGNATVNIGNLVGEQVDIAILDNSGNPVKDSDGKYTYTKSAATTVTGANVTGNVYGGGNLADVGKTHLGTDNEGKTIDVIDVVGNTFVNICATNIQPVLDANSQPTGTYTFTPVGVGTSGVTIGGNVFGGGKGEAAPSGDGAFRCGKAMVTGGTNVHIGNGTVGTLSEGTLVEGTGNVYGGGEVGRVEVNTVVTIGKEGADENTSNPTIRGSVFGAGKGVATHGYSALVRGNSTVTIQGFAKVGESVYGGGEIASVGRYNVGADGIPTSLASETSGNCIVTVLDNAEIGPNNMTMFHVDGSGNIVPDDEPDNSGHVFGAGKGAMPVADYKTARHMTNGNTMAGFASEADYLKFIESLGLATQTEVTIGGNAFVKGDVFGGAEQGFVQHNTHVIIQDDCQIGNGYVQMDADGGYLARTDRYSLNRRYTATEWSNGHLENVAGYDNSLPECASWEYASPYAPHDEFADKYESKGGALVATNGSTFYGNVFGGGSGYFSYAPGKWHWKAGDVGGNTIVEIKGGHVLTNVYGGNELTNVAGTSTVTMSGGTIGVPRTLGQIAAHPVTCYLFGGGKGDPRVLFNKQTNIQDAIVNITGGWIYGSVFGGGEDGHVMRDVTMSISDNAKIGTWGTSYVDGNVFGGGRGFAGDAYTAGNVAGSVNMTISGGTMLGSIYGGGRLGSVGYGLYEATETEAETGHKMYGEMQDDGYGDWYKNSSDEYVRDAITNFKRGHVEIKISGGTIGNDYEFQDVPTNITTDGLAAWKTTNHVPNTTYETTSKTTGETTKYTHRLLHTKGGNVYAGGMGRREQLDGTSVITAVDWHKLGNVKSTKLTITGGTIKSNVYGGGEFGAVQGTHTTAEKQWGTEINITGGTIGTEIVDETAEGKPVMYTFGSVYGGGTGTIVDVESNISTPVSDVNKLSAYVANNAKVAVTDAIVRASVYGGGELGAVGGNTDVTISGTTKIGRDEVKPATDADAGYVMFGGWRMGNVYGGGRGSEQSTIAGLVKGNTNVNVSGGNVYHMVYGGGALGSVGTFTVSKGTGEEAYVPAGIPLHWTEGTGTATVNITGGVIGISGRDNGLVFGSSRGDLTKPVDGLDPYDRVAWVNKSVVTIGTPKANPTDPDDLSKPLIKGSVYGGGENGHNNERATVNVYSGTIGITKKIPGTETDDPWYSFTDKNLEKRALPYRGNVYGAGSGSDTYKGDDNEEHWNPKSGMVAGNTFVNIAGGLVGRSVYGGGAMSSIGTENNSGSITAGTGTTTVTISGGQIGGDNSEDQTIGNVFGAARGDETTQTGLAQVQNTNVMISAGTVKGSVFGGGERGVTLGSVVVNMTGGTVVKDIYGGGALADTNTGNWDATKNNGQGGWADGKSSATYTTTVNLLGGSINDVYGGALGQKAGVNGAANNAPDVAAIVYGDVKVNLNGLDKSFYDAADATMKTVFDGLVNTEGATTYPLKTSLKGCIVDRIFGANNVNGTPLGHAKVHIYATQNKDAAKTTITAKFANDNINLTNITISELKGMLADLIQEATVINVTNTYQDTYDNGSATADDVKTAINGLNEAIKSQISDENTPPADIAALNALIYDVKAVYGGGDQADYRPISTEEFAEVIIDGCDLTSIEDVYGGGNAAATPATDVKINGCYMIDNVFGGGNGTVKAADVGYTNYLGTAKTNLSGGYIHKVFGGSNTNGNILHGSYVTNEKLSEETCDLKVSEVFGGGNVAPMQGGTEVVLGCMPGDWIDEVYAGAQNADVTGDVMLTITSGKFGRVFGGNKSSGKLDGGIVVNIEENPNCPTPIIIGELYGGGNMAPYSAYGYDKGTGQLLRKGETGANPTASPVVVHAKAFTSIGKIFGGGKGAAAELIGNPWVLVDEVENEKTYEGDNTTTTLENGLIKKTLSDDTEVTLYPRTSTGTMGVVGTIFGGGNKAKVTGNTTVKIASYEYVVFWSAPELDDVRGFYTYERDNDESPYEYKLVEDKGVKVPPTPGTLYYKKVQGADIRGNIYGGGNNAAVTGDTNVVIGRKAE